MNDLIKISNSIQTKIHELEKGRAIIKDRATDKAEAISEYEKAISLTILKIKNGMITEFEGQQIDEKLPANLVEKIAKGICWQEKLAVEKTEGFYKAAIVGMQSIMSELNGLQSLNKYLDKI
jgi:predicted  nucleic acid-binding Zn-ribbon protein